MQKNNITNKISPCGNLAFSVVYWWVQNLTLNSEADRQFILSKISQNGTISIEAWKILANSATLETDASFNKPTLLSWFDCGKQPSKDQLKIIIEGLKIGNYSEPEFPENIALIDKVISGLKVDGNVYTKAQIDTMISGGWRLKMVSEEYNGKIIRKVDSVVGGNGAIPSELSSLIGKYESDGGFVTDKNQALNYRVDVIKRTTVLGHRDSTALSEGTGVLSAVIDEEISESVRISGFTGTFGTAGVLVMFILNGKKPHEPAPQFTEFDILQQINIDVESGLQTVDLTDFDIIVDAGSYVGFDISSTALPLYGSPFNGGWFQSGFSYAGSTYFIGTKVEGAGFDIEFFSEKSRFVQFSDIEIKTTKITVARNAENYNSIRNKVKELKGLATEKNPIELLIPSGEWFESDIIETGDFLTLVGEDCLKTILYCDGNSTKITPSDYSFTTYANTALNAVPAIYKHVVNARGNIKIKDLTIRANNAKYCAHLDSQDYDFCNFKNVRFVDFGDLSNTVGIGLNGGQTLRFHECEFTIDNVVDRWKTGVFFHNWNNQTKPCKVEIHNSFFNCNYILLDELGSDQRDVIELINCDAVSGFGIAVMVDSMGSSTFWTNENNVKETDPLKVPYNIFLNATGTKIESITARAYGQITNPRPLMAEYIRGRYTSLF